MGRTEQKNKYNKKIYVNINKPRKMDFVTVGEGFIDVTKDKNRICTVVF
jgi:hypothetical protein